MRTAGRSRVFDIELHLSTIGAAQADDPSYLASVYKRHVVKDFGFRSECDHSPLSVLEPFVNLHQLGFPVEVACH